MFERFTQDARDAVIQAQTEANELGDDHIGTQHVLLGVLWNAEGPGKRLLDEAGLCYRDTRQQLEADNPVDAEALRGIGIDLDAVRRRAESVFGKGALRRRAGRTRAGRIRGGHIPFDTEAKKTLELALREAIELGHSGISTSHVLLGLTRLPGSPAGQLMTAQGVRPEDLGSRLREQLRRAA